MSGSSERKSRRFPLHLTMSAVFTTLLVVFGVALIVCAILLILLAG